MKQFKYFIKMTAGEVPPETLIYKNTPDPRSRQRLKLYTITNKISFYSDGNNEVVQYAKKMLYLIDSKGDISFIDPNRYVSVGFSSIKDMQLFLEKIKGD